MAATANLDTCRMGAVNALSAFNARMPSPVGAHMGWLFTNPFNLMNQNSVARTPT